jgi:hypothetical protein
MPRSFDLSVEYSATVEQVHGAYRDEDYWLARLADSGADIATLDSMTVQPDGSLQVVTTQAVRVDRLPAFVTQFHRGDLRIVRTEKWSPVSDGEAQGEVTGHLPGAPASVSGKAALKPTAAGSRLEFNATVEVNIPLLGGKLESLIAGALADLFIAEQRFTTAWIAQNA